MNPRFSIITVCYNSARTIERCINSVRRQNYEDYEHIIIDGGSSDGTRNILERYDDRRVRVVSEQDAGIYDAMNKGIALATGEYLYLLNSDDYFANENVLKLLDNVYKSRPTSFLCGNIDIVDVNGKTKRRIRSKRFRKWMMVFGWMLPQPAWCVPKEYYNLSGCYDITYETGADFEYLVRMLFRDRQSVLILDEVLVKMEVGGATTSGWKSYWRTTREIRRALQRYNVYTNYIFLLLRLPIKFISQKL